MTKNVLLVDFGSTYTKAIALNMDDEMILGRSQSATTIETDIMIGLNRAMLDLEKQCGISPKSYSERYASSSAAGGLKMAAIGLVPSLTLEAACRACLGAGAKVVCSYGYEIDEDIIRDIERNKCDIIMLAGGTDGGNKTVILHNAKMLAGSSIGCPIIVCGNKSVQKEVRRILEDAGKCVYTTNNVLPSLNIVDVEPAQQYIRDIFIDHIVKAKGLSGAQAYIGKSIIPTPMASLSAAALLADGTESNPGIGSLLVVEIGGATTNVHSVSDNEPVNQQAIIRGLPESYIKRTVEGDLGIRWNSHTLFEMAGQERLMSNLREIKRVCPAEVDFSEYTNFLFANVGHTPVTELEYDLDITLAYTSAGIAVERHAGKLHTEPSIMGDISVQYGKNLLNVKNVIGTGGIFRYGKASQRILKAAMYSSDTPESLRPINPEGWLDNEYILYGIGLISKDYPDKAIRIAKKYLTPVEI